MTEEDLKWRKAKLSAMDGNCVEFAIKVIAVRDSGDPNGPILEVPWLVWRSFLTEIKQGKFDWS
jgi:Domain of unknown function (DUF397)